MIILSRVGMYLFAAIAGGVYGIVGTVAQASTLWGLPVGLVLALIGSSALILAIRLLSDRGSTLAAAVGLVLAIVVLSGNGTGGSVIAPADDLKVWVWALSCPLLAGLIVAWPAQTRFAARPATTQQHSN